MRGMGRYTEVERELSHLSADEMNELYLSGDLDKIYDDFDRSNNLSLNKSTEREED